jgi:RNA polymerase sigma-70 factor, ECF subfamily
MTLNERRLGGRIRAGDPQVFQDLYDAYGARVLGYALRLTGAREDAEDLVQETFVGAYSSRATYQGRAKLLSWLLGITTRRWRDGLRHGGAQRRPPTSELRSDVAYDPEVEGGVVRALTLAQALARLDPPFREALLLVRSQGLTYAEAAEIVGEPEGTVKWRVYEAARRAQKLLNGMDGECDEVQREPTTEDRSACSR